MTQRTLKAELHLLAAVERPAHYEIATLTRHDIPDLATLRLAAYGEPETLEDLAETTEEMRMTFDGIFGKPLDNSFVGAWTEGTLVGALLAVAEPCWEEDAVGPVVLDLMVHPEFQRQGIATALVGEIARRLDAQGEESLSLRLDAHQVAASSLYDMMGFKEN